MNRYCVDRNIGSEGNNAGEGNNMFSEMLFSPIVPDDFIPWEFIMNSWRRNDGTKSANHNKVNTRYDSLSKMVQTLCLHDNELDGRL